MIGLLAIAGLLVWQRLGAGTATPGTPQAARSEPLPDAKVSSFDPSGGSGFRSEGNSTWRTQTYRSATFGNLKPGVGLLLDLGSKQQLSEVTLNATTDGLTVELRAADDRAASVDGYKQVGKPAQASGATTLKADSGGAHRYWLIWVTKLAAVDGGFRAEIGKPVARAAG